MNRFAGPALSLLRIVSGLLFICPGGLKLFGWFGGMPPGAMTPLLTAAGLIEVVGGTLILLGLFTRPVAFIASGEMAVAFFKAHFPHGFWPIQNHGELAVILCFLFLYFSTAGAGPVSLDAVIRRHRAGPQQPPRLVHSDLEHAPAHVKQA
jgi:putative oxidoreductase